MITSTSNQKVKELLRLQSKSRAREEQGLFLVEGPRMTGEIPPKRIACLYMSESYANKTGEKLADARNRGIKTEIFSDDVFSRVSDTKTPQGVLAAVRMMEYEFRDILGGNGEHHSLSHVLVLENLQDPGNMGTIFRSAEAAGATGILMSRDCVDVYNPKVIRSTMGAIFRIPFYRTDNLVQSIEELKNNEIQVYAAHLKGRNTYDGEDYRQGCAFLIGNEGNGLRPETAACADRLVRIPMEGEAESLNAAVAASVLMFEAARQRRGMQLQ